LHARVRVLEVDAEESQGTAEALADGLSRVVAAFVAAGEREEETARAHSRWLESSARSGLDAGNKGAGAGTGHARGRAAAELLARAPVAGFGVSGELRNALAAAAGELQHEEDEENEDEDA